MKNVLHKIGKDIWAYVACVIVVVLAWSWVFSFLTRIKTEEKVSVFIGSYSAAFEKSEELNADKPEYLKVVEVNAYSVKDNMFATFLSVFGYEVGDILILPESCLSEEGCAGYYAEISDAYKAHFEGLGADLGYYNSTAGKTYGIKIHDKESKESLIDCIEYGEGEDEENYYLLFNKKSVHLSDLSDENNKSEMDGAIKIAEKLLTL